MTPLLVLAALLALIAVLWLIGAGEPAYRLRSEKPVWFVALRAGDACALRPGARLLWSARTDFAFIGAAEPYWDRFLLVEGDAGSPLADKAFEDAYVARLRLFAPPKLALGVVRLLVASGVLTRPPTDTVATDAQALGFRAELMPSADAITTLMSKRADYAPAMVNFLSYFDKSKTNENESGRAAYRRYGAAAMRTVYRTGGRLLFYGAVMEVARAAAGGPMAGAWNDIAAMRYPNPPAILSMEHVPAYRAALAHRDAGLERTVVVASTPD